MTTSTGLALAERHRIAQGTLASQAAKAMLSLFPLLVAGGRVDQNNDTWLAAVIRLLTTQRDRSAALGAQFLTAYRFAELGPDSLTDGGIAVPVLAFPTEAVTTSMSVLGPVAYRRELGRQLNVDARDLTPKDLSTYRLPEQVQATLAANTARSAMRHVRNGSRDTMDAAMKSDKKVVGYVRSTNAGCCWFCAMLASRGPVYEGDSFADSDPRFHGPGNQKVHDGCGCELRPLYTRDSPEDFNVRAREFARIWAATGNVKDFRAAYSAAA